eukprot:363770-Chlamydomonas_euryale.AAC.11
MGLRLPAPVVSRLSGASQLWPAALSEGLSRGPLHHALRPPCPVASAVAGHVAGCVEGLVASPVAGTVAGPVAGPDAPAYCTHPDVAPAATPALDAEPPTRKSGLRPPQNAMARRRPPPRPI